MGCWIPSWFPALLPLFSPQRQQSLWLVDAHFAWIASQSLPQAASKTEEQLPPATTSPNIHPKSPAPGRGPGVASDAQQCSAPSYKVRSDVPSPAGTADGKGILASHIADSWCRGWQGGQAHIKLTIKRLQGTKAESKNILKSGSISQACDPSSASRFYLTLNLCVASKPRRKRQAGNAGWKLAETAACREALRCTKGAVILVSASRHGHSAV